VRRLGVTKGEIVDVLLISANHQLASHIFNKAGRALAAIRYRLPF